MEMVFYVTILAGFMCCFAFDGFNSNPLNFLLQGLGSAQDFGMQMIGNLMLGIGIPERANALETRADETRAGLGEIWDNTTATIDQSANQLDAEWGNPSDWKARSDQVAADMNKTTEEAAGMYDRAKEQTASTMAKIEQDREEFAADKAEALQDTNFVTAQAMKELNAGNVAFVQQAKASAIKGLQAEGRLDDPMAVAQAEGALVQGYHNKLGDDRTAIKAKHLEGRIKLHKDFAETRQKMNQGHNQIKVMAEANEQAMGKHLSNTRITATQTTFDAAKAAGRMAIEVKKAIDGMRVMASGIRDQIFTRGMNLDLAAEDLRTQGVVMMSGNFTQWRTNVPQYIPDGGSGGRGRDDGGSFSTSIGVPGVASAGYTT